MENKIIKGYIKDFKEDFGIEENKEDILFEKFANYCIVSRIHPEAFSSDFEKIEEMNVGGGEDTGIDGLGIFVNDHLVSSIDEIKAIMETHKRFDTQFVFIQTKTSPKFEASEVGTFIFGVKNFFSEESSIKFNDNIDLYRKIKDYIYEEKTIDMISKPICSIYYVTTGKWVDDINVLGRANAEKKHLEDLGIFEKVEFVPVDADKLGGIYLEIKNKIKREITFEKRVALPSINGVREAYIGVLPISEYLKLIVSSDDKIQKNLFYDNVRDFLGNNTVNKEIGNTLSNEEEQDKFAILNNGVTIVAKSVMTSGDKVVISDFQIVNGCQTSHVIYNNKEKLVNTKASIPIKLIVTDEYEVANQITKATNRQTEVKIEAFASLEPFHKKLEEYYNSCVKEYNIYYARRSNQYDNSSPPIAKEKIITLSAQINAYLSMFLNEPHSTHRYYGELLKAYDRKIFDKKHILEMYHVSALTLHIIEKLFKSNKDIDTLFLKKNKFKYHLLVVFRILVGGFIYPQFSSKDMIKYCDKLYKVLSNRKDTIEVLIEAVNIIKETQKEYDKKDFRDLHRKKDFTYELIEKTKKYTKIKKGDKK